MPEQFIRPKQAAIEAGAHSQQIYDAIRHRRVRHRRVRAERRGGKVFIERASFERWRYALETRRRLLSEERRERGGRVESRAF
jgi:hypothetical protein